MPRKQLSGAFALFSPTCSWLNLTSWILLWMRLQGASPCPCHLTGHTQRGCWAKQPITIPPQPVMTYFQSKNAWNLCFEGFKNLLPSLSVWLQAPETRRCGVKDVAFRWSIFVQEGFSSPGGRHLLHGCPWSPIGIIPTFHPGDI